MQLTNSSGNSNDNNSNNSTKSKPIVTRKEYLEYGHFYCNEKMKKW